MATMTEQELLNAYFRLHDGLSDMIESGRLKASDIPDDYRWLVEQLATLAGEGDAFNAAPIAFRELRVGNTFTFEQGGAVFVRCHGGYRPGRGGPLMKENGSTAVYRYFS